MHLEIGMDDVMCIDCDHYFSSFRRRKKVTKLIRMGGKMCIFRFAAMHKTGSMQNGKCTLL